MAGRLEWGGDGSDRETNKKGKGELGKELAPGKGREFRDTMFLQG